MPRPDGQRLSLTRRQRAALRALLIRATAAAGRACDRGALNRLVQAAPIEVLPAAAALHRVGGTVLRGLDGVADVPDEVRERLDAVRQRSALHHLTVTAELARIGRAFDNVELSWVAMKGPVVAALLYPHVGERSYSDLDLLVDGRDFARSVQILEDLGYQHHIHNWALAEQMLAGEIQLSQGSVVVDLHWHLHYSPEDRRPFALEPATMIERRRQVAVSGVTAPTLDPVDTLVTLAFHAARSDGHRLIWLKDVERAVSIERPDLDELVRRSATYRCGPPVGVILDRARRLVDADVPTEIIRALVPIGIRATDLVAQSLTAPVQLHERVTITRMVTRSIRSSIVGSVWDMPTRAARRLRRRLVRPPENETDDAVEKQRYLDAVALSSRP